MRTESSFDLMETMKFLKVLLVSFVVVAASVLVIGLLLPQDWEVERSVVMRAPPEKIYPYIVDLKRWPEWVSSEFLDPDMQTTFSGATSGVGAKRTWRSKVLGNGSQIITSADPHEGIRFERHLERRGFILFGEIRFDPMVDGTKVTWRDYGHVGINPFHRYMAFSMDQMFGDSFEKSLHNLKTKVEADASLSSNRDR